MSKTSTQITVQVNGVAVTGTVADIKALIGTGPKVRTRISAEAKAKRSTKAQPKAEPKVARFVDTTKGSLVEATLGELTRGTIVALRATGAQYLIGAVKGDKVALHHPDGRVFDYDKTRSVFVVGTV